MNKAACFAWLAVNVDLVIGEMMNAGTEL